VNRPVFQFETEHAAVIQFTTPSMDINIQSKRTEEGYRTGRLYISSFRSSCTARKILFMYSFSMKCGLSPNFHIHVSVRDLYIPRIGIHISLQQNRQTDLENYRYINLSHIYVRRNWETEHCNSVLEIKVSFLGIHKWEPDIYIGFSPALLCSVVL
jgi:hypothetical protein